MNKKTLFPIILIFVFLLLVFFVSSYEKSYRINVYANENTNGQITLNINGDTPHANMNLYRIPSESFAKYYFEREDYRRSITPVQSWTFTGKQKEGERTISSWYDEKAKKYRYEKEKYTYYVLNSLKTLTLDKGLYAVEGTYNTLSDRDIFHVSDISLVAKHSENGITVFAINKKTGMPLEGAEVLLYNKIDLIKGTKTDQFGIASIVTATDYSLMLVNYRGESTFMDFSNSYRDDDRWDAYESYFYTDRPIYRPNQTVYFKAIFWTNERQKDLVQGNYVDFVVYDSKNDKVYENSLLTDEYGAIFDKFTLEEEPDLGNYRIEFQLGERRRFYHSFKVEEYRKPEYEVNMNTEDSVYLGGQEVEVDLESKYYFGEPVKNANIEYQVFKSYYRRPCWGGYFRCLYAPYNDYVPYYGGVGDMISEGRATTDENGKAVIRFKTETNDYLMKYYVEAKVTDLARKEVSNTAAITVIPALYYIRASSDKYYYGINENVLINLETKDYYDVPVSANLDVKVERTYYTGWSFKEKRDTIVEGTAATVDGKGAFNFNPPEYGRYVITISGKDEKGNTATTEFRLRVYDVNNNFYRNLNLEPDKQAYDAGDIANIVIESPIKDAYGILTVEGDAVYDVFPVFLDTYTKTVQVPIKSEYEPNVYISVSFLINNTILRATQQMIVLPKDKIINITVTPDQETYGAGDTAHFTIKMVDHQDNPVKASFSFGMVDEPIYALAPDNSGDIFAKVNTFMRNDVNTKYSSRQYWRNPYIQSHKEYAPGELLAYTLLVVLALIIIAAIIWLIVLCAKTGHPGWAIGIPVACFWLIFLPILLAFVVGEPEFLIPLILGVPLILAVFIGLIVMLAKTYHKKLAITMGVVLGVLILLLVAAFLLLATRSTMRMSGGMYADDMVMQKSSFNSIAEEIESAPMAEMADGAGGAPRSGGQAEEYVKPVVRKFFPDVVVWKPDMITDSDGMATLDVELPDTLTTWRSTIKAYTPDMLSGQIINKIITRKNVLVRFETSRTFTQGDEATISAVVHNYLPHDKEVKVDLEIDDILDAKQTNSKIITVQAGQDKRVDFKVQVMGCCETKATLYSLTDEESDAVEMTIPIVPSGVKEYDYDAGNVDTLTELIINIQDGELVTDATEFNLYLSPSIASLALDSLPYLIGYPHGCVEQTMSRFLPDIIVLRAIETLGLERDDLKEELLPMIVAGLERLYDMQNGDGSWGWWKYGDGNAFMTAYVVYGLTEAQNSRFEVDDWRINRGLDWLKDHDKRVDDPNTRAYIHYVLSLHGMAEPEKIYKQRDKMSDYGKALLALAYHRSGDTQKAAEIVELLENSANCNTRECNWEGGRYHWRYNNVEATSYVMRALIKIKPESNKIPKAVNYLVRTRRGNHWYSTKDTAQAIFALTDYMMVSGELNPDYTFRIYQDGLLIKEDRITKDNVMTYDGKVELHPRPYSVIRVEKEGSGMLYYSKQLEYFVKSRNINADSNGITVTRQYSKYNIKAGDEFNVTLTIDSDADYEYIIIEDYIPAGTEVVQDKINDFYSYYRHWGYSNKEIRDEKVDTFYTRLNKGQRNITYQLRAEFPGLYVAMPAQAHCMYAPEINGRSASTGITIYD